MVACFCDEHSFSVLPFDELRIHFKVDFFHDSAAFKQALRSKKYSKILLNYNIDLLKAIRTDTHYNGCPIIVATSEEFETHRPLALSAGAHDFYTNRLNPQDLLLKLKSGKPR